MRMRFLYRYPELVTWLGRMNLHGIDDTGKILEVESKTVVFLNYILGSEANISRPDRRSFEQRPSQKYVITCKHESIHEINNQKR